MANAISIQIDLEGKQAINTIKALEKGVSGLGSTGTKSIGSMTSAMKVFQGVVGAQVLLKSIELTGRALKQGAKDALDFGTTIQEINSIAPRTAQATLVLKKSLLELSSEFGGDAQKQARAFYDIVSAGVQGTAKQLNTLEIANKAAVAGLVDINSAAKVLVSSVNSYEESGLTAQEASDVLFNTVKEGITTFGALSQSIGVVAPTAAAAGLSFADLGGTLAFITKAGIDTSRAVTGVQAILTAVIKPSEEAAKYAQQLGLNFSTAAIKSKGFVGFMKSVKEATGGSEVALAKLFPNIRALPAALRITGGSFEDFARILDATKNSSGSTEKAFATITKSAGFQFDKLTNQLKNFPTSILTNFEGPLSTALEAVNAFVSNQGVLLIPQAVDFIVSSFQDLLNLTDDIKDFGASIGQLGSDIVNALSMGDAGTDVEDLTDQLAGLERALANVEMRGRAARLDNGAIQENRKEIEKSIEIVKNQIDVLTQSDVADAKVTQNELKRRQERNASIDAFRKQAADAEAAFIAQSEKRKKDAAAKDKERAKKQVEDAVAADTRKFSAINELAAAQKELEAEQKEEDAIEKELKAEEDYLFLEENLGRENVLRELNRIADIEDEKKRQDELKKLRKKATKEEQGSILAFRKFEDLTNKEKIAAQKSTLSTISSLSSSSNGVLFAIGKASSLALAGINVAESVTKALAAFPPPFSFAAAAAVGAAGAINIAKIASAKKPSAGSFQAGGIVEGASQTGDQLTANVNGGEAIFNRRQQQNLFNAVDQGTIGGGSNTNNISIQSVTGTIPQEQIDSLIDQMNDRTEFGNKELRAS